jgi:hypothetical protein
MGCEGKQATGTPQANAQIAHTRTGHPHPYGPPTRGYPLHQTTRYPGHPHATPGHPPAPQASRTLPRPPAPPGHPHATQATRTLPRPPAPPGHPHPQATHPLPRPPAPSTGHPPATQATRTPRPPARGGPTIYVPGPTLIGCERTAYSRATPCGWPGGRLAWGAAGLRAAGLRAAGLRAAGLWRGRLAWGGWVA